MIGQREYTSRQNTAFLDIINPVLWDLLEKKFKFKKMPIEDVIASGRIDHLFFYNSSDLEATKNSEAVKVSVMIRRNLMPDTPPDTDDPVMRYVNFYKLYLNKYVTAEVLDEYIRMDERSIITDLLIFSKYVYAKDSYEKGKMLAKKVLRQVAKYDLPLTCMYVYLYKAIQKTNLKNGLEEYRAFFKKTVESDSSRNIYLRFLLNSKNDHDYQEIKKVILSTKKIYYPNLIKFFVEYIKYIRCDSYLLKQDIDEITAHLKTAEFQQRDTVFSHQEKVLHRISTKIQKIQNKTYKELKYIGVDDLVLYRHNNYLDSDTLHLIEIAIGHKSSEDLLYEVETAANMSEPLAAQLIINHLQDENRDQYVTREIFTSVLPKLSIEYLRDLIDNQMIEKSKDHDILMTLFLKKKSYVEIIGAIYAGYIDASRLDIAILTTVVNACRTVDRKVEFIFEFVENKNDALSIIGKAKLYKHVISNYFEHILECVEILNWNHIRDIYTAIPVRSTGKLRSFTSEILKVKGEEAYPKLGNCIAHLRGSINQATIVNDLVERSTSEHEHIYIYLLNLLKGLDTSYLISDKCSRDEIFFDKLLIKSIFLTYQLRNFDSFDQKITDHTWYLSIRYLNNNCLGDVDCMEMLQLICGLSCAHCTYFNKNEILAKYVARYSPHFVEMFVKMINKLTLKYGILVYSSDSTPSGSEYLLSRDDFDKFMAVLSSYFIAVGAHLIKGKLTEDSCRDLVKVLDFIKTIKNFDRVIEFRDQSSITTYFFRILQIFLFSIVDDDRYQDTLNVDMAKRLLDMLSILDPQLGVLPTDPTADNTIYFFLKLTLRTEDINRFKIHVQLLNAMCSLSTIDENTKCNLNLSVIYISYSIKNYCDKISDEDFALLKDVVAKNAMRLSQNISSENGIPKLLQSIFEILSDSERFLCTEEEAESIAEAMSYNYGRNFHINDIISSLASYNFEDSLSTFTSQNLSRRLGIKKNSKAGRSI